MSQGACRLALPAIIPLMETDFLQWLDQQQGRQYDLHSEHINPAFTETIACAIKFARCNTLSHQIVYCDHAFLGLTLCSHSINGADFFRERFGDLLPETQQVPFNDLPKLEEVLAQKTAAAFILEPVQGKSCEVLADGYLAEARRLCTKYGTLLILDEVQAGLGRTGKWFCYQHWP